MIFQRIWRNFLTGLLIILPAMVTIFILRFIFGWMFGLINPVAFRVSDWIMPGQDVFFAQVLVLILFLTAVACIGWGTRILVVQRTLAFGEGVLQKVPLIGKVYKTIRQIAQTFSGGKTKAFNEVVILEWPREGMYAIGFVTSDANTQVRDKTGDDVINLFVPTTPNPTSGYLVMVSRDKVTHLDVSVEEGLRMVVSAGVSGPEAPAQDSSDAPTDD